MPRPRKLERAEVDGWVAERQGWTVEDGALVRAFATKDFAEALALANAIGAVAEAKNHHPDILIGWGKARVTWTTHDAGGVTTLDLELAAETDRLAAGR